MCFSCVTLKLTFDLIFKIKSKIGFLDLVILNVLCISMRGFPWTTDDPVFVDKLMVVPTGEKF